MSETIDGNMTLADQESAVQFKDAKGYQLQSLKAVGASPPTNEAEFEQLPDGQLPDLLKLVIGSVPVGETEVWSGTIYIEGKQKKAAAYRQPE